MAYGVVVFPLTKDAPEDLRVIGRDFVPGVWTNRGVGIITSTYEILQETMPSPLGSFLLDEYRSHIDFGDMPIGSHEIFAVERIQSKDVLNLDLIVIHIAFTNESLNTIEELAELRRAALKRISDSLDIHPGFVMENRRAICAIETRDATYDGRAVVFGDAELDGSREVMTWGTEAAILAAIQYFAAQEVTSRLPLDVREYVKDENLELLQVFNDKYWVPRFIVKKQAQKLVDLIHEKKATTILAENLQNIYRTSLENAERAKLDRINSRVLILGAISVVLAIVALIR